MKFIRLLLLSLPLIISVIVQAQSSPDIIDPGTGTFPMNGRWDRQDKDSEQREEEEVEMQKEEEELDSFGNDEYNENVDPDSYKVDEVDNVLE